MSTDVTYTYFHAWIKKKQKTCGKAVCINYLQWNYYCTIPNLEYHRLPYIPHITCTSISDENFKKKILSYHIYCLIYCTVLSIWDERLPDIIENKDTVYTAVSKVACWPGG